MEPKISVIIPLLLTLALSACVTHQYENNSKEPLSHTEANYNEMAMTRISLGLGYLKIGNTSQAKLNLEKAKKHAPKLPHVHSAFAHYYEQVGEADLASASYQEALSLDEDNADILNNFGVFLCKQKRIYDAEKYMLKAIAIPTYLLVAQSYENLALCVLTEQMFYRAEGYLEKSISHSPSRASALLLMAKLQYAKADYHRAIHFLHNYKKSVQRLSASALALIYKTNMHLNRVRVADNYADMLLKMFPNSFEAKEYQLNELEIIEADELALQYIDRHSDDSSIRSATFEIKERGEVKRVGKRTIVLSPTSNNNVSKVEPISPIEPTEIEPTEIEPTEIDDGADVDTVDTASENDIADVYTETTVDIVDSSLTTDETPETQETETLAVEEVSDEPITADPVEEKEGVTFHVIVKGDNLFSISRKYNIRMSSLEQWNDIDRSQVVKIGDVIKIVEPK